MEFPGLDDSSPVAQPIQELVEEKKEDTTGGKKGKR
tara:strand:- start:163 stop:270 length:108 start_codon:yes stop_codon:yes gene_type:complete